MDNKARRIFTLLCVLMAVVILQNTAIITLMSIDRCGGAGTITEEKHEGPGSAPVDESSELTPEVIGPDLRFGKCPVNTTGSEVTLTDIIIADYMDGEKVRDDFILPAQNVLPPDALTAAPGEEVFFEDWHPALDALEIFDERHYIFVFITSDGGEFRQEYVYMLDPIREEILAQNQTQIQAGSTDYSQDEGRDLLTLRYDANFSVEVYPGVYWVSARTLGDSRYTNAEISAMLPARPEEKQMDISTLYEALQLYQIGGFYASDDNIRLPENGVNWEHHKPGYDAVRTNTGCCATDSNWLRYILDGDYDEVGYIATSQRDGSGHIYNYILQGGQYYFIDLTHYRTDWIATAVESGSMDDYYASDRLLGNIHRADSVDRFVECVQNTFGDPPGMMFKYTAENCLAIDGLRGEDGVTIIYEDAPGVELEVIFDDPNDSMTHTIVPGPGSRPDYSAFPGHAF